MHLQHYKSKFCRAVCFTPPQYAGYNSCLHDLEEINVQLFPFTGPMPTVSQPPVKRIHLDDSQVQSQGTVMVLVRWYVLMMCIVHVCRHSISGKQSPNEHI